MQIHSTLNLSSQPCQVSGGAICGETISISMQQPMELRMFPRKQHETTPRPSHGLSLLGCAVELLLQSRRKSLHNPPVLGKRKGFGQGMEGTSDLGEVENRGTARPQHLTHSGLSPWIKAAKHRGICLEVGAIPALGHSIQEESERKESHKHGML